MNWTNVSTSKKYLLENYINQGIFDNSELKLFSTYNFNKGMDYEDFFLR